MQAAGLQKHFPALIDAVIHERRPPARRWFWLVYRQRLLYVLNSGVDIKWFPILSRPCTMGNEARVYFCDHALGPCIFRGIDWLRSDPIRTVPYWIKRRGEIKLLLCDYRRCRALPKIRVVHHRVSVLIASELPNRLGPVYFIYSLSRFDKLTHMHLFVGKSGWLRSRAILPLIHPHGVCVLLPDSTDDRVERQPVFWIEK